MVKILSRQTQEVNALRRLTNAVGLTAYDGRIPLTKSQRARVRRLAREHSHLLEHPEKYIVRHVGKKTAAAWKDFDYTIIKKKGNKKHTIFIPKRDTIKLHITKDHIFRETEERITHEFSAKDEKLLAKLDKVLSRPDRDLDEYITVQIGKNSPFTTAFYDLDTLGKYLSNWIPWKMVDGQRVYMPEERDQFIEKMHIVRFKHTESQFIEPQERKLLAKAEKRRSSKAKKRPSKATRTPRRRK